MDGTHLHLALNHIPVLGVAFALLVVLVGMVRLNGVTQRLGLAIVLLIAVVTFGVMVTGESAEETAERLPGVTEEVIEQHEDAAKTAAVVSNVLGVLAVFGLVAFRKRERLPRAYMAVVLVVTLVACGLMARTAYLGGQVRHTEIRPGASITVAEPGSAVAPEDEAGGDD